MNMKLSIVIASMLLALTPEVHGNAAGKAKAIAVCNVCHGANGLSQMPNAPHLAGQPEMYVREQLRAYRSGKRQHEVMAIIAKPLTDDEIADLSAWYASIEMTATVK